MKKSPFLLATSELRKRPGKSEVDNASWDCFRGQVFCLHSPKTAVVRVAPKLAAHQPFYSFTKEVVSRSEVTQKVGEISLLLCQDILSFLLRP